MWSGVIDFAKQDCVLHNLAETCVVAGGYRLWRTRKIYVFLFEDLRYGVVIVHFEVVGHATFRFPLFFLFLSSLENHGTVVPIILRVKTIWYR